MTTPKYACRSRFGVGEDRRISCGAVRAAHDICACLRRMRRFQLRRNLRLKRKSAGKISDPAFPALNRYVALHMRDRIFMHWEALDAISQCQAAPARNETFADLIKATL